jgi:anti-sigma regulatory factor (Ser/Thr protein kinase)
MEFRMSAEPTGGATSRPHHHFRVRIPNDLALVKPLRDLISSLCRLDGYDDEKTQEIALVATELINNAIEHTGVPASTEIRGGSYDDRLELSVIDEAIEALGDGSFDFDGPPDAANERGRGLFLVQAFADRIRVSPVEGGGNRIDVVWFRNGGAADEV